MNSLATSSPEKNLPKLMFKFPFKAVSFQQARFYGNKVIKTEYQKNFLRDVGKILISGNKACKTFSDAYDPKKHVMIGQWFFFYENFFTKKEGIINSLNPDIENGKKMVQDSIFKFMGLNDKDIVHSDDIKWKGQDSIIFTLKLMEIEEFQKIVEIKVKGL